MAFPTRYLKTLSEPELQHLLEEALSTAQRSTKLLECLKQELEHWADDLPVAKGMRTLSRVYATETDARQALQLAITPQPKKDSFQPITTHYSYSWLRWLIYNAGCHYDEGQCGMLVTSWVPGVALQITVSCWGGYLSKIDANLLCA